MMAKDGLLPAIDVLTRAEAERWFALLAGKVTTVKIGLRLFIAEGPSIVRAATDHGLSVFLDLKLHDIPSTVREAAGAAASLGVRMMTVHASGGAAMVKAAVEGAAGRAQIIAVTVLTSHSEDEARAIWRDDRTASARVLDWAVASVSVGADGVVASPLEAAALRAALPPVKGAPAFIITPGIRPAGSTADDQARAATPGAALRAGATHLVVGRPILGAADPAAATDAILREMEEVP